MGSLRRRGLALALIGLWAIGAAPALAADNGTVDAQVTVATPCIIVTPDFVDFGTLPFTPSAYDTRGVGTAPLGYESCSGIEETVFARGSDATGTSATWTLSRDGYPCLNPSPNLYRLWLNAQTSLSLSTQDQQLEVVAAGAPGTVTALNIHMPCAGSDGAGELMSLQVVFTATF